jgi:hypothetical protein
VIEEKDISDKVAGIEAELQRVFGIKAKPLEKALRKAGRLLPANLHKKAQVIVQAQSYSGNPKLMRFVEGDDLTRAYDDIMAFLKDIDPNERRIGTGLDILTGSAMTLLITATLVVAVLIWQGYL